ncbi:MAG: hypothetical protein ACI8QZ_000991 [Chlamydiales bacterium]|jgi:hypothetical protein
MGAMSAPRQPRPAKISTAPLFMFLGLVALLGVILGLVGRINKKKIEEAEVTAKEQVAVQERKAAVDPFADLPQEVGIGAGARGSRWATALARDPDPTGLEADEVWQLALDQADAAWVLSDRARRAMVAEDQAKLETSSREARLAFQKALDGSEDWLAAMLREHGDRDDQVRKVIRTRATWTEQMQHLRKSVRH